MSGAWWSIHLDFLSLFGLFPLILQVQSLCGLFPICLYKIISFPVTQCWFLPWITVLLKWHYNHIWYLHPRQTHLETRNYTPVLTLQLWYQPKQAEYSFSKMPGTRSISDWIFNFLILKYLHTHELSRGWDPSPSTNLPVFPIHFLRSHVLALATHTLSIQPTGHLINPSSVWSDGEPLWEYVEFSLGAQCWCWKRFQIWGF